MKTLLSFVLIILSVSAYSSNRACESIIEELGIDPAQPADGQIRRFTLQGATSEGEVCSIQFLPDFCSFQIGSPLKINEMYYLMDTETSYVKITFRRGEKFFVRAVTKETNTPHWTWNVFTKTLEMEKFADGYRMSFSWKEGRIIQDELAGFTCTARKVATALGPE